MKTLSLTTAAALAFVLAISSSFAVAADGPAVNPAVAAPTAGIEGVTINTPDPDAAMAAQVRAASDEAARQYIESSAFVANGTGESVVAAVGLVLIAGLIYWIARMARVQPGSIRNTRTSSVTRTH